MNRRRALSIVFGLVAALMIGEIGLLYGTPLLIVALPVVFLTISRVVTGSTIEPDFEWILFAFSVAWLLVFEFVSPLVRNAPDSWPTWVGLGVIPLLLAITLAIRRRLRPA